MLGSRTRRVGQNRIYTPYMTVHLVDFLPYHIHIVYIIGFGQPYSLIVEVPRVRKGW